MNGAQDSQSKIFLSRSSSTPELSLSVKNESIAFNRQFSTSSFSEVESIDLYRQRSSISFPEVVCLDSVSASSFHSYTILTNLSTNWSFRRSDSEPGCGCLEFVKQMIKDMFKRFFRGELEQKKCRLGFSVKAGGIYIREEFLFDNLDPHLIKISRD
ncbi:hypothetical protein NE237_023137 [Protea cynaroides]|uniref:Uncharacterized protein n=1 Tax=Protea cynaroides TaxID=273540 RepID=A0A9Q0K6D6_9MAGN|nr:hypothetical protein NE237_023137 [Protea cynaroides]